MSIKFKLVYSFLSVVLLLLSIGYINIYNQQQTAIKFKQIATKTSAQMSALNQINTYIFSVIKDTFNIVIIEEAIKKKNQVTVSSEHKKQQQKINSIYKTNKKFIKWSQNLQNLVSSDQQKDICLKISQEGEKIFAICLQIISERGNSANFFLLRNNLQLLESNFQVLVSQVTKANIDSFFKGNTEADKRVNKSIVYSALGSLLAMAIACILALFLYKGIINPINLLKNGTKQVAKENFTCDIKIESWDEFAELVQAFNHMSRMLENHRKRIDDNTKVIQLKNKDLAHALKHKSEFLANMSHELRTPLNAMIGYTTVTQKALKNKVEERHLQNLQFATQAAKTLLHLINDILDFSKIETGKVRISPKMINLSEVIQDCAITAKSMLTNRPVEVKTELFSNIPQVKSDRAKVEQILRNLLNNSAKFTTEGEIRIRASFMKSKESVYIEIEDTGCGIPKENITKVFEVFTQGDSSTKKSFSGSGLGLAIAKKLCDMLGIEIGVHSEIDKGSTFWLMVPLRFFGEEDSVLLTTSTTSSQLDIKPFKEVFETKSDNALQVLNAEQENSPPSSLVKDAKSTDNEKKQVNSSTSSIMRDATNISNEKKQVNSSTSSIMIRDSTNISNEKKQELAISQKDVMMQDVWIGCITKHDTFNTLKELLDDLPMIIREIKDVEMLSMKTNTNKLWAIIVEPDYVGFENLMYIKNNDNVNKFPVIMCSSNNNSIKSWGKVDHISKPISEEQLINILLRIGKNNSGEILIVDCDDNCHQVYKDTLENLGYKAVIATSAVEALDYLGSNQNPALCFLDLLLPAENSFKLFDSLRNTEKWRSIPIVIATDQHLSSEQQERLKKGSFLLLEKGNVEDLKKNVYTAVNDVETIHINTALIIDDNSMNLHLASEICQDAGYTVYQASSAKQGIEMCEKYLPDFVVMDLAMPGMDGFEATRVIKKSPKIAHIPVIACSAFAMDEFRKRAIEAGCCDFIVKPISTETFATQVKKNIIINQIKRMYDEKDFVGR
ncbi:response regulator [Candidatus Uabimicrobium sp. HlEnr_7]|uniref:response regulator n=1 Tax=Candidatus Uabimicrobium helgolandensis TaxID=3095367 RepID=UPI00355875B5